MLSASTGINFQRVDLNIQSVITGKKLHSSAGRRFKTLVPKKNVCWIKNINVRSKSAVCFYVKLKYVHKNGDWIETERDIV